jgi:hypothetical protein
MSTFEFIAAICKTGLGHHERTVRWRLDEPSKKVGTGSCHRKPVNPVGAPDWTGGWRHHRRWARVLGGLVQAQEAFAAAGPPINRRASADDRGFDSNADSTARELWRTLANHGELLTPAVSFKMNAGKPCRTLADDAPANVKTGARDPWRCRGTDRSCRTPANLLKCKPLASDGTLRHAICCDSRSPFRPVQIVRS